MRWICDRRGWLDCSLFSVSETFSQPVKVLAFCVRLCSRANGASFLFFIQDFANKARTQNLAWEVGEKKGGCPGRFLWVEPKKRETT